MSKVKLQKHTLNLREGDVEAIRDAFPKKGAAFVIRSVVSRFVDQLNPALSDEEIQSVNLESLND